MTAQKFVPEIEALYSKDDSGVSGPRLGATDNLGATQYYVRACIGSSFTVPSLGKEDDLYDLGLDSLKTAEIVGMLKSGLGDPDTSWLSVQTMYANPTIQSLSEVIQKRLSWKGGSSDEDHDVEELRITKMASFVHKYTQDLSIASSKRSQLL